MSASKAAFPEPPWLHQWCHPVSHTSFIRSIPTCSLQFLHEWIALPVHKKPPSLGTLSASFIIEPPTWQRYSLQQLSITGMSTSTSEYVYLNVYSFKYRHKSLE
jgi:hypothetical protein